MGKGWHAVRACIECGSSEHDRADVQGLCVQCKSFERRRWPVWLDRCLRCDRHKVESLYFKKGLCRRCAVQLGLRFIRGVGKPAQDVAVWYELFEDMRDSSKSSKDRLAMSFVKVMGVAESAAFLGITEGEMRKWVDAGVPECRRMEVIQKRMDLPNWRPAPLEVVPAEALAGSRSGGWMDEF